MNGNEKPIILPTKNLILKNEQFVNQISHLEKFKSV